MSADKLVTCPYDEAHKLKSSRLQLHIAKCKMNHLDLPKKACPFNATHLLDAVEMDYHLQHCPDRGPLDRLVSQMSLDGNNPYKGRTAVPHFSDTHLEDEENWDAEVSRTIVRPSEPPQGAIIEPPPMSKPAERKKLYQNLHQMQPEPERKSSPDVEVLRQPKQKSQGEQVKVQQNNAKVIENLGLGRGRPSRIAANFEKSSNGPAENATYSNIASNLGLARGRPVNEAAAAPIFEKDDFPPLLCGRGALRAPKQSLRTPGAKHEK